MGFPTIAGWYRGFSTKNRAVKGIFPSSYVHLKPCKIDNEGLFESVIPLEDPVVREVTLVLREWGGIWKRLYVVSIYTSFCTSFFPLPHPLFSLRKDLSLYSDWGDIFPLLKLWSMEKKIAILFVCSCSSVHFFASAFGKIYIILILIINRGSLNSSILGMNFHWSHNLLLFFI